tara:strand:- start:205 stop:918 length:714 start_codon:yes stop_codon:yes gene_type:complete
MAKITEINGNIFNTSCQVIVNTVNCLGVMGKGIAYEFKLRYPDMYEKYKEYCDKGVIQIGTLQHWSKSNPEILNFPTKNDWKRPSKIEYLEKGLEKLAETYQKRNISSIAFPYLGVGAGGLDEQKVLELMKSKLSPLDNLEVEIYSYDPNANDNAFDLLVSKTKRFSNDDYKTYIGLNKTQTKNLIEAIEDSRYSQTIQLQYIQGISIKSLEKIHTFINSNQKIITNSEANPSLPFS